MRPTNKKILPFRKILQFLKNPTTLGYAGIFVLLLWLIFGTQYIKYDDAPFYMQRALLYLQQGLRVGTLFPYLTESMTKIYQTDPWFGFHLILIPFAKLGFFGLKIFSLVFISALIAAFTFLLKKLGIHRRLALWTAIFLFSSPYFFFRMDLARPITICIILLLIFLAGLFKRNYWLVAIVSMLFVLTYEVALPLVIGALGCWWIATLLCRQKPDYKTTLYALGGLAAGILLHLQPINYLHFVYIQDVKILVATFGVQTRFGTEYLPPGFGVFKMNMLVNAAAWIIAALMFFAQIKTKATKEKIFLLIVTTISFFAMILKQRFIEYFIPFSTLFFALVIEEFLRDTWPRLTQTRFAEFMKKTVSKAQVITISAALLLVALLFGILQLHNAYDDVSQVPNPDKFHAAVDVLAAKSNYGDLVFNTQWDQFPYLFYRNPKNFYIIGMDPNFFYLYDKNRFWLWNHISIDDTYICQTQFCYGNGTYDILGAIQSTFNPKFIFVENGKNPNLKRLLDASADPGVQKIYSDQRVSLYQVHP